MRVYAAALVFCLIAGFIIGMADANTQLIAATQKAEEKIEKEEDAVQGTSDAEEKVGASPSFSRNALPRNHATPSVSPSKSPSKSPSPNASSGESGSPSKSGELDSLEEAVPAFSRRTEPAVITHVVRRGETLYSIAKTYGTDTKSIVYMNKLDDPDLIEVGWKLRVLTRPGVFRRVQPGDTLWSLSLEHQIEVEDVISINGITDPDRIVPGDLLLLPKTTLQSGRAGRNAFITSISRRNRPELTGFLWPVNGPITSGFGPRWGRMHYGVDIGAPVGTQVVATKDGRVVHSGWYGSYGKVVILEHEGGVRTVYAHLSSISDRSTERGNLVRQNQVIGRVGNTGFSIGPHLHFEIRTYGRAIDPLTVLPPQ